jgi:hypothetical protein
MRTEGPIIAIKGFLRFTDNKLQSEAKTTTMLIDYETVICKNKFISKYIFVMKC